MKYEMAEGAVVKDTASKKSAGGVFGLNDWVKRLGAIVPPVLRMNSKLSQPRGPSVSSFSLPWSRSPGLLASGLVGATSERVW